MGKGKLAYLRYGGVQLAPRHIVDIG